MKFKINNKFVGENIKDTYYTKRTNKHFMKMFEGFGISQSILNKLVKFKIRKVIIIYINGKKIKKYKTTLNKFFNSKKEYIDTMHGIKDLQRFVSINEMEELK